MANVSYQGPLPMPTGVQTGTLVPAAPEPPEETADQNREEPETEAEE